MTEPKYIYLGTQLFLYVRTRAQHEGVSYRVGTDRRVGGEEAGVEKGEGAHWGKTLAAKPVGKRISSHKVFPDLHVHHAYTRTYS